MVYPLNVFLENARQAVIVSAVGLAIAAAVIFLRYALSPADKAPIEPKIFLVTAFASVVAAGYITLWALTVRNFWKFGSLLTSVLALGFAWWVYGAGAEAASSLADMLTRLTSAAPLVALLLLAVIGLTTLCYAHFFLALAFLVLCLVVGWFGQRLLRRLLRFSLEALQEADPRPPVLFLRAFRDGQVPLRAPKTALFIRSISCCSTKPPHMVRWSDSAAPPTNARLTARPAAISPPRPGKTRSRNLRRAQPSL